MLHPLVVAAAEAAPIVGAVANVSRTEKKEAWATGGMKQVGVFRRLSSQSDDLI